MSRKPKEDQVVKGRSKKAKTPQPTEAVVKPEPKPAEKLAELEQTISRGFASFVEVGLALMQINDKELYKSVAKNFADYCLQRWGMTDRYAYRLIAAANCMLTLRKEFPKGKPLPINEAQIRPMCDGFDKPTKWIKAWQKVLKSTKGKPITAEKVEQVVNSMLGKPAEKKHPDQQTGKSLPNKMLRKVVGLINKALAKRQGANGQFYKSILEEIRSLIQDRSQAAKSS